MKTISLRSLILLVLNNAESDNPKQTDKVISEHLDEVVQTRSLLAPVLLTRLKVTFATALVNVTS